MRSKLFEVELKNGSKFHCLAMSLSEAEQLYLGKAVCIKEINTNYIKVSESCIEFYQKHPSLTK